MGAYLTRRLLLMIPTLIGMTFLIFMLIALSPGGIGAALRVSGGGQMDASNRATQQAYLEDRYGLDAPVVLQYVRWLGRVSPIRFGTRDQIGPAGDRIRPPKPIKMPVLWQWFADDLPEPPDAPPVDFRDASPEERASVYRRAADDYARARNGYIAQSIAVSLKIGEYFKDIGRPRLVAADGKVRPDRAAAVEPDRSHPLWDEIAAEGAKMMAAYAESIAARERLAAVFAARPFAQSGVGIIPGLLSLDKPDLGVSFSRKEPVGRLIARALPVTLMLNLIAFPIIYIVAIPSGMLAATRQGSLFDIGSGATFVALWSIPIVWAGVLAVGFLANDQYLGAFPVAGLHDADARHFTFLPTTIDGHWHRGYLLDTLWHICLPVACLTYTGFAILSKQTRAAMLDNFNADYVRTAKAKGVPGRDIVFRHVFRNSLLPLITLFVSIFPAMLAGSVVIERIFSIPGMGSMVIEAIYLRDRELLLANAMIIGLVNMLALLLADVLYALADPRITYD
ncbi:MAG: ABC transporter permease [Phycisphaerales bacterium JB039]